MENQYDVGIANRYALFMEEGDNSLTAIKKKLSKEQRQRNKAIKKENAEAKNAEAQEKPPKPEPKPLNDVSPVKKGIIWDHYFSAVRSILFVLYGRGGVIRVVDNVGPRPRIRTQVLLTKLHNTRRGQRTCALAEHSSLGLGYVTADLDFRSKFSVTFTLIRGSLCCFRNERSEAGAAENEGKETEWRKREQVR